MSNEVLQTIIICITILLIIGGYGMGVLVYTWKDRDGSMSLKARENALKAEKLADDFKRIGPPK